MTVVMPVTIIVTKLLVDVTLILNRISVRPQTRQVRPAEVQLGLLPAAAKTLVNIESRKTALTTIIIVTGCVRRGRARR